ncbi:outer membrane lipoprotein-sorting protein [Thiohalorhabdus sp.]|uniref:outer membrane lipoprotein-sorting protein n=1 Tax=Thiohalorhabdus sp. TaxID=3094134 RepID=UPI002FC3B396
MADKIPIPRGTVGGFLASLLALAVVLPASPVEAGERGRELARKVDQRPDGEDAAIRSTMVLQSSGAEPRVRKLRTFRLDRGDKEVWSLTRFVEPANIDGTGLLTRDYAGGETDQWLFLPALEKVRRIAGDRKGGRFVGSDLFYEDLRDREASMDRHRLRGTESLDGTTTKVLVSTPVDPGNSTYSKRVRWIHPRTLIDLRVDFYKKAREEPIKRMRVHRIEKVQGYWTVMDSTTTDLRSGHKTRIRVEELRYDQGLPEDLFNRRVLSSPGEADRFQP